MTHDAGIVAATLADRGEAPALGRGARSVQIRGDVIYWIADDRAGPSPTTWTSFIVEWRPGFPPHVLFKAERPGAVLQSLAVSERWLAWLEHRDQTVGGDTQLYVRAASGAITMVDDVSHHGTVVTFPEMALSGDDLFWTVPRIVNGRWNGVLLHKRLPSGPVQTIERREGQIFSWPAAYDGIVAYEVVRQEASSEYRVRYRLSSGEIHDIATSQASEPSVGADYIAFKNASRYEGGSIAVIDLAAGTLRELARGEAPLAVGPFVTWFDMQANEAIVTRLSDRCIARYTANRASGQLGEGAGVLSGSRLAWPVLVNTNGVISEVVRTATLVSMPC